MEREQEMLTHTRTVRVIAGVLTLFAAAGGCTTAGGGRGTLHDGVEAGVTFQPTAGPP